MSKLSRAIKFILAIWIVAFCLAVPQAMQFGVIDVEGGGAYCTVSLCLIFNKLSSIVLCKFFKLYIRKKFKCKI